MHLQINSVYIRRDNEETSDVPSFPERPMEHLRVCICIIIVLCRDAYLSRRIVPACQVSCRGYRTNERLMQLMKVGTI